LAKHINVYLLYMYICAALLLVLQLVVSYQVIDYFISFHYNSHKIKIVLNENKRNQIISKLLNEKIKEKKTS